MSAADEEVPITARVAERPKLAPGKLREVHGRELGYRFMAGALTSIAAGLMTLALGARVGGLLLAFPAILAASLTLIEEQEDSAEAREDARGAVIGGCALAAFAAVAALTLGSTDGAVALLLATITWTVVAMVGYALAWFPLGRGQDPLAARVQQERGGYQALHGSVDEEGNQPRQGRAARAPGSGREGSGHRPAR